MVRIQITDLTQVGREETLARVERSSGGVVLLRDPQLDAGELLAWARELRAATHAVDASLWVNDRLDVAAIVGADGVHLGRRSVDVADARELLPAGSISVSAHSLGDVAKARELTVDFVMLSPIFASPGKSTPLGLDAIREASALLEGSPTRLVALGGLDLVRGLACIEAGAEAVAAIRADLSVRR